MPTYRSHTIFDLTRGVKAFLHLDTGIVRGEALGVGRQKGAQGQKYRRSQNRIETQDWQVAPRGTAVLEKETQSVVERFHKLYYDSGWSGGTWHDTYWLGVPTWKCPFDLWVYQEIIFDLKPNLIIECGTAFGGSALFLACMCDLTNRGEIITIDIQDMQSRPQHKRLNYLLGSSTDEDVLKQVRPYVANSHTTMVILDSDHRKDHVASELQTYSQFVTKGSYIIVEDTSVNGHPVLPDHGPGPMEAVQDFLKVNEEFIADSSKEKFYLTFNPKGFLKKIR